MINSTRSSESALRSSRKRESTLTSPGSTPRSSTMMSRTRSKVDAMWLPPLYKVMTKIAVALYPMRGHTGNNRQCPDRFDGACCCGYDHAASKGTHCYDESYGRPTDRKPQG